MKTWQAIGVVFIIILCTIGMRSIFYWAVEDDNTQESEPLVEAPKAEPPKEDTSKYDVWVWKSVDLCAQKVPKGYRIVFNGEVYGAQIYERYYNRWMFIYKRCCNLGWSTTVEPWLVAKDSCKAKEYINQHKLYTGFKPLRP